MNRQNDSLLFDDSDMQLNKNISRLVKLVDDSDIPSKGFINSLIDSALNELRRLDIQAKREQKYTILQIPLMKKAMGWAAMFAVACGTGLVIILSTLLQINTCLAVIFILTMFANWLIYLGGLIS